MLFLSCLFFTENVKGTNKPTLFFLTGSRFYIRKHLIKKHPFDLIINHLKYTSKSFDDCMRLIKKYISNVSFFLLDESEIDDDQKKWLDWVYALLITGKEESIRFPRPSSNDLSCHLSSGESRADPELSLHLSFAGRG